MLCTHARLEDKWKLAIDNWLKTKLTLLCIKVSKSPICLGHHAAQSSAVMQGDMDILK